MRSAYAGFEWDDRKAISNLQKHHVGFAEAIFVFFDPLRIESIDARKNYGEPRWKTIGLAADVLLAVVYTVRGPDPQDIRIISARKARQNERRQYDQAQD